MSYRHYDRSSMVLGGSLRASSELERGPGTNWRDSSRRRRPMSCRPSKSASMLQKRSAGSSGRLGRNRIRRPPRSMSWRKSKRSGCPRTLIIPSALKEHHEKRSKGNSVLLKHSDTMFVPEHKGHAHLEISQLSLPLNHSLSSTPFSTPNPRTSQKLPVLLDNVG